MDIGFLNIGPATIWEAKTESGVRFLMRNATGAIDVKVNSITVPSRLNSDLTNAAKAENLVIGELDGQ